jgi:hypothetical protein
MRAPGGWRPPDLVGVTARRLGRGTVIIREWGEGGPSSCLLCASGCRAYRAADSGRPVCICVTPEPIAQEEAAGYRDRPGTRWMSGPEGRRLGTGGR